MPFLSKLFVHLSLSLILILAVVFLLTGFEKIGSMKVFERTIVSHQVIGTSWVELVAWGVVIIELGAGVFGLGLLVVNWRRFVPMVAILFGIIFLAFTSYAVVAWMATERVPVEGCGCGLPLLPKADLWTQVVARDSVISAVLGIIALLTNPARTRDIAGHTVGSRMSEQSLR